MAATSGPVRFRYCLRSAGKTVDWPMITCAGSEKRKAVWKKKRAKNGCATRLLFFRVRTVYLRRENKITLGESFDFVCVSDCVDFSPGQTQIGMMAFGFRHCAGAVYEGQGRLEIGKEEGLLQVMAIHNFPIGKLRGQLG